jgi:hypothetical protein
MKPIHEQPSLALALRRLNDLESLGLIRRWAIGGAAALVHYTEPVSTFDVDIFTELPAAGLLVTLEPVYSHLRGLGFEAHGDAVLVEGIPIQFLPTVPGSLEEEAVERAVDFDVEGTPARVFTLEHLAAISLELYRPKDKQRLVLLAGILDETKLLAILNRQPAISLARWTQVKGLYGLDA